MATRLRRILAGVTFDEPTERGVAWVARHFAPEAELVLLHCLEDEGADEAEAEQRLERMAAWAAPRAERMVRAGSPEKLIAQVADEAGADVIAIGPRADTGGALGSTAERILAESRLPVLVTRHAPEHAPRSILGTIDESEAARLVLEWVGTLAGKHGVAVSILHVVSRTMYGSVRTVSSHRSTDEALRRGQEGAEHWLAEQVAAAGLSASDMDLQVEVGTPDEAIVQQARASDADLIIMGSRGAGLIGRTLLGSTAGSVVREAGCPVFVVPARASGD